MNHPPISRWRRWAWATIAIHFMAILWLGLSRHSGYLTSINDLGVFDQAVWGTMHGQFLLNTSQLNQPINWLGFHFHPVLLLFVPLYAIAPNPEWLTLAQALAQVSGLALIASMAMGYNTLAPLPIPCAINFWAPARLSSSPDPSMRAVHAAVGDSTTVSAQANIGAYFSQRKEIYSYPNNAKEVDAIVLRLDSPTTRLHPQDTGKSASLAWYLKMRPAEYLASVKSRLSGCGERKKP